MRNSGRRLSAPSDSAQMRGLVAGAHALLDRRAELGGGQAIFRNEIGLVRRAPSETDFSGLRNRRRDDDLVSRDHRRCGNGFSIRAHHREAGQRLAITRSQAIAEIMKTDMKFAILQQE